MRNLLNFIIKHNYIFLFVILEVLSIYLVVQNNYYQNGIAVSSANKLAGNIYQTMNDVSEYFSLKTTNKLLAEENARLRAKVIDSVFVNDTLKVKVDDKIYKQQYEYITSKVINNTVKKQKNYITISKGSKNGIESGMGVITSNGIVGVVKNVSENFSTIVSFLAADELEISVKLKKSGYAGTLLWNRRGTREALLKDVNTYVKVGKGDTLITSGYANVFPQGIFVGTVTNFEKNAGENFYSIDVQLSTDFSNLSYVYVVRNLHKDEQEKLESKNSNEK